MAVSVISHYSIMDYTKHGEWSVFMATVETRMKNSEMFHCDLTLCARREQLDMSTSAAEEIIVVFLWMPELQAEGRQRVINIHCSSEDHGKDLFLFFRSTGA
ncbi:hypothetical protein F2P79_019228 [Pimephales promelas]|nr:hypothetical protein F2P79_019228 [Pimephales promelas]